MRREYWITSAASKAPAAARSRSRPTTCWNTATKLAVIEAKLGTNRGRRRRAGQGLRRKLAVRFNYATNGRGIYAVDMLTGKESEAPAAHPARCASPRPTSCGPPRSKNPTSGATVSPPCRMSKKAPTGAFVII